MNSSAIFSEFPEGKNFIAMVISDDDSGSHSSVSSSPDKVMGNQTNLIIDKGKNDLGSNNKEKKRWSFMSNHSLNSSNKRWSTLSLNTNGDFNGKEKGSTKEAFSQSSIKSSKRISITSGGSSGEHAIAIKIPSLKRSSTSSSLKQLFNKIAINDDSFDNKDKENSLKALPSFYNLNQKVDLRQTNTTTMRSPLSPLNDNILTPKNQRHSVFLHPANVRKENSFSHSHTPSFNAPNSAKWKFWKRDSNLSRSGSLQTLDIVAVDRNHGFTESKLKKKASFSSIFTSNSNFGDSDENTLKKKPSTSNLSIGGLKHKTSHSSLQQFKLRRKVSNNNIQMNGTSVAGKSQISLPIPDKASRHKIKTKLQNSNSLVSLQSFVSSTPVVKADYDQNILQQILEICDVKYFVDDNDLNSKNRKIYKLSSKKQNISTHVWRFLDETTSETIICKKLSLGTFEDALCSKELCLQELIALRLCKNTMGLPFLLQSYIYREDRYKSRSDANDDDGLYLMLFLKDNGTPLSRIPLVNWSQSLSIFWQCTTALYVMETKFLFEHRNLNHDHILVDSVGNVTLCDFKSSRFQSNNEAQTIYTRLDHPFFYQGSKDYQYEIYDLMRELLPSPSSWRSFEPRTNLLWLHYLVVKLLEKGNKRQSGDKSKYKLLKLSQLLEPSSTESEISGIFSCGDLLKLRELI